MKKPRVLVFVPAYNEGARLLRTLGNMEKALGARALREGFDVSVVLADDGSDDGAPGEAESRFPFLRVVKHAKRLGQRGLLASLRKRLGEGGFDFAVTLAGNGKDDPREMVRLLRPLVRGEADVVQGSRYLEGTRSRNMPRLRAVATKIIHPILTSIAARRRLTDSTNGFRSYRRQVLLDRRMGVDAPWLSGYAVEPFLLIRSARLGYRLLEVSVSKTYPSPGEAYTKMRPFADGWGILKPALLMALGLRS
jgi:dolichol-phosphate mannosyltransferase